MFIYINNIYHIYIYIYIYIYTYSHIYNVYIFTYIYVRKNSSFIDKLSLVVLLILKLFAVYSLFSTYKGNTKQFLVFLFQNSKFHTLLTTKTFRIDSIRVNLDKRFGQRCISYH